MKRSLAVAYALHKRAMQHRSHSPSHTMTGYQPPHSKTHPTQPDDEANLSLRHQSAADKANMAARTEDDRSLNQHGEIEEGPQGTAYAEGGNVGPQEETAVSREAREFAEDTKDMEPSERQKLLEMHRENTRSKSLLGGSSASDEYAEGGTIDPEPLPYDDSDSHMTGDAGSGSVGSLNTDNYADEEDGDGTDMVSRIMKQRQQMFSEGGRVANSDHGVDDEDLAGFSPNEFDDLTLRDDLDFSYDAANSGDNLGNERTEQDQEDEVARIMKRRKQQRNPNPA